MLVSIFFVSLVSVGVKFIHRLSIYEIVFYKSAVALVITIGALLHQQIPIWGKSRGLLLARGATNALQIILYFVTVQHIPLPTAFTIRQITPIFTALLGVIVVKESLSLRQLIFFAISFAGIVLLNGFVVTDASWYIFVGLISALVGAISYVLVSKMKDKEHPLVIAVYGYLMSIFLTVPYLVNDFVIPQWHEALIIIGISILGYLVQYYSIKAYQYGPVALVSASYYAGVVYTLIFSYLFFGEVLPPVKFLGLALVLLGVLLNIFYGQKRKVD